MSSVRVSDNLDPNADDAIMEDMAPPWPDGGGRRGARLTGASG